MLLDSEPAAFSSVPFILVTRSLIGSLSGRDDVTTAAAAAARLGVHVDRHHRIRVVVPDVNVKHLHVRNALKDRKKKKTE